MTDETKIGQFFNAAIKGQIDTVRQLLKENPSQDKKDEAFGLAIAHSNLDIADLLLDNGADLCNNSGENMYWACHNEEFDSVKYLIDKGIDVNCQDGIAAFMLSQKGNPEIIKWIHRKGANLSIKEDAPLINAIIYGNTEIAEYLLENGANPNAQNGAPVREAGIKANLEIFKRLIEKGGRIEGYAVQAKKMKATWLFKTEHVSIIKYLLKMDIDEKSRNDYILNWVVNYNNRYNLILNKKPFKKTEQLLQANGLNLKMFLPKKKWFGLFG